jgi:hypothetical protein
VSDPAFDDTVFLFDVDNTLLDNDRIIVDSSNGSGWSSATRIISAHCNVTAWRTRATLTSRSQPVPSLCGYC